MRIRAVLGDITKEQVDAVVNAANSGMRGGGGVDGAIHRAGGPAIMEDCIARFPNGMATGDAGWTTAGDLPASWVIHTVGPNYAAGQRDRKLLESCYSNALARADELGARSIAFPLISAGVYGWPVQDAINAAIDTILATRTSVEDARIVAFDKDLLSRVEFELARDVPFQILRAVRLLHERGYHSLRIFPGMSPSGMSWRISLAPASNFTEDAYGLKLIDFDSALHYTSAMKTRFANGEITVTSPIEEVADLILAAQPSLDYETKDPAYVEWYAGLLDLCEQHSAVPIAYSDSSTDTAKWQIGWDGATYAPPPK